MWYFQGLEEAQAIQFNSISSYVLKWESCGFGANFALTAFTVLEET